MTIDDLARRQRLADFLDAVARRPLVWGRDDCLFGYAARWIEQERGVDPAAPWRGRLPSKMACLLLVNRRGGLVAFMDEVLAAVGVTRTRFAAREGDLGVITTLSEDGYTLAAAISTGRGQWAVRMAGGICLQPAVAWAVWEV